MIETLQEFNEKVNKKILVLDDTKLNEQKFVEFNKKHEENMKAQQNRIEDLSNCLKFTDNYLEKYQPFNAFCQLFEILRMALDPMQVAKVKDYEEYRLKQLYEIILQDKGKPLTSFNKEYVMEPVGYTLDFLKDT